MTVAELIALLNEQPQDARVMVDGYEGGFHDPVIRFGVASAARKETSYEGDYEEWTIDHGAIAGEGPHGGPYGPAVPVIVVARNSNIYWQPRDWPEAVRQADMQSGKSPGETA